jgi:hypothetical protein
VNESEDKKIAVKNISHLKIDDWRLSDQEKEMKVNDLNDSNEMNEVNEMKMIENSTIDDFNETKEYVMENEIPEDERMNESEHNSDSELEK